MLQQIVLFIYLGNFAVHAFCASIFADTFFRGVLVSQHSDDVRYVVNLRFGGNNWHKQAYEIRNDFHVCEHMRKITLA